MPTKMTSQIKFITYFFLTMNIFNNAYGEIKRNQYFSYVSECAGTTRLNDFIEAEVLRSQKVAVEITQAKNDQEILHHLHQSIRHLSPVRSEELMETYSRLKKEMVLSDGIKIPTPAEPDNILELPNCALKTVAVSMQTINENDELKNRVVVDSLIWEKLRLYEQVAVLLDFALAEELRDENLIPSRIFMGYWFSSSFKNISLADWQQLRTYLKLPYYEYKGFKVIGSYFGTTFFLYKKSKFKMNGKTILVSGQARFYNDSKNLEAITEVEPFDFELAPGQWVKAYAEDPHHNSNNILTFFDNEYFQIKSGLYKAENMLAINGHTINPNSPQKLNFSFHSPDALELLDAHEAQLKIRNRSYKVVSMHSAAHIRFYENGAIRSAMMFKAGQSFDLKNGKQHVIKDTLVYDFNCEGYPGPNSDRHCY